MLWAKTPFITNLSSSPYFSFGYTTKVAPPAYTYSHFAVFYQKLMCKPFFIILLFHSRVKFFLVLLITLFTFIQCVFSIFLSATVIVFSYARIVVCSDCISGRISICAILTGQTVCTIFSVLTINTVPAFQTL